MEFGYAGVSTSGRFGRSARTLAAGLLVTLVIACSSGPSPTGAPSPAPEPSATADPLAARTEAEISVPGAPDFPIGAFESLWLLTPDQTEPGITRLDPTTNEIVATIKGGSTLCQAIGASDDAVWMCTAGGVARVDPETNEVSTKVEFPIAQYFGYLPFGAGSLWALSGQVTLTDKLVRIDPQANRVVDTYPLGFDAEWISFGESAVWLSDTANGKLWRFDPQTEALSEFALDLPEPRESAVGAGSVWVVVRSSRDNPPAAGDPTIVRLNPATGAVQAEIATSAGGNLFEALIYASDEAVWVRAPEPFLTRIDPATNQIAETLDADFAAGSVTVAFGSVWATSYDFGRVWRLRP